VWGEGENSAWKRVEKGILLLGIYNSVSQCSRFKLGIFKRRNRKGGSMVKGELGSGKILNGRVICTDPGGKMADRGTLRKKPGNWGGMP